MSSKNPVEQCTPSRSATASAARLSATWRFLNGLALASNVDMSTSGPDRPVALTFLNAYTGGMSGGDIWFIEVARRTPQVKWLVVTSASGVRACTDRGLTADFIVTSGEETFRGVVTTYLRRTATAIWRTRGVSADIIVATSDAPPDVVPAAWHRAVRRQPPTAWVQRVFHLVPRRRGRIPAYVVQLTGHLVIAALCDLIVVDSENLRRQLTKRGVRKHRTIVSKPGIADFPVISSSSPPTQFEAIYVGRLNRSKGVLDLPAIWGEVLTRVPEARLGIAGYGAPTMVAELTRRIVAAGVADHVSLLGFIPDANLRSLHEAARSFVFPSHEEGFGIAVLNAMSLGLPVVAWKLPALEEHFANSIDMVQEGDVGSFADHVCRLLLDDAYLSARKAQARERARRYDWNLTAATEYDLALAPLIADGRRRKRLLGDSTSGGGHRLHASADEVTERNEGLL